MTNDIPVEIARALPDDSARERFVEYVDLMRVLADCVIADDYTISDALNSTLQLTAAGDQIFRRAVTAKTDPIPPKEARLLCALAIGEDDIFIDLEETDLHALASAISEQVKSGKVRFPYEFGRSSYDVYASMFDEGQAVLTYSDTQKFLDATPPGVQQYGQFVSGPFGLLRSRSTRQVHSGRRIEAFHCSDSMCDVVHRVHLTTSAAAAINLHRDRFNCLLRDDDHKSTDWFGAADEIRDVPAILFSDAHVGVAATLIGDGLSEDELRALVGYLLDSTSGELRADIDGLLRVGNATDATADLTHAELMQIALLARETYLREALDALVDGAEIRVPRGEVRRPVVNRDRRSGAFGLSPELGEHGVRFSSQDEGFAMLRLRHEVGSLTNLADGDEADELAWQIRDIEGETLAERLDTFFRVVDPGECIERLVLPRRSHVARLAKRLGIAHGMEGTDGQLVARFLWKLGYPLHDEEDPRAEFWRLHQRLTGLAKASHTPGSRETEEFLGTASKFFRELERYLAESLAFTAWALLHDHATDPNPFEYGLEADHARGMSFVQAAADEADDPIKSFDFLSDKLDLYTLIRGFEFLAKALVSLDAKRDDHRRDDSAIPAYARGSELKRFPFMYTAPYLNLTDRSRTRLAEQLREIARSLQRGKVTDIRNEHQHYRKTASGVEQIESALREVEVSLRSLESSGLSLVEFRLEDAIHDRWGRSEFYFAAPRGARHVVTRPSGYDWLGLPELDAPQYVAPGAVFAEPNEVLRFRRRIDSPYTQLWSDFPKRRRSRSSGLSQSGVEHPGADVRNT